MKVKYNIKKVQFVPIESMDVKGTPTYGTALKLPGTVSLTLEAQGESSPVYADGMAYWVAGASNTYTGELQNLLFTTEILKKLYGYFEDAAKNLVEADEMPKEFGCQFACDSDDGEVYFTLYRCSSTKPGENLQTKEGDVTVNPQTVTLTISPVAMADGTMIIKSYATKTATNYNDYFDAITIPTKG